MPASRTASERVLAEDLGAPGRFGCRYHRGVPQLPQTCLRHGLFSWFKGIPRRQEEVGVHENALAHPGCSGMDEGGPRSSGSWASERGIGASPAGIADRTAFFSAAHRPAFGTHSYRAMPPKPEPSAAHPPPGQSSHISDCTNTASAVRPLSRRAGRQAFSRPRGRGMGKDRAMGSKALTNHRSPAFPSMARPAVVEALDVVAPLGPSLGGGSPDP